VQKIIWITVLVLWLPAASLLAQAFQQVVDTKNDASLDAQQEKRALQSLMKIVEREILSTVDAEILIYLKGSFVHLEKAVQAIGQTNIPVNASPISPLKRGEVTRLALITETLLHAYDHYGQMVEYLRMNGVVPPASRP